MKPDSSPSSSEELSSLAAWDRSFWLSRAFIEASCVLCTGMLGGSYSSQYSSSRVILHLARQGIELFLKASIEAKQKTPAKKVHHLDDLFLKYRQLYPDIKFHFDAPKQLLIGLNFDLFQSTEQATLDQRHRYATDREGNSFATPETFDPLSVHQSLSELRTVLTTLEWSEIRPLVTTK